MTDFKLIAKQYTDLHLSVIPTGLDKLPALESWKPFQKNIITPQEINQVFKTNTAGLAVICGSVSGQLEVIDVDCKYDLTGTLWEDLKRLIEDNLGDLMPKLVIAQTPSNGYHIYYRCSTVGGNLKLANRPSTEAEKEATYQKRLEKTGDEEKARKAKQNDKVKVLIETRGEGGYVIAPPTKGYKYIHGSLNAIPEISKEQRSVLFSIAKSFNLFEEPEEAVKQAKDPNKKNNNTFTGLSPFEDYNQRGDVVELLKDHGWTEIRSQGARVQMLRPGDTGSKTSGNYHTELRKFLVFSTSTDFTPGEGYSPVDVFAKLECNGDLTEASKKLYDLGYGDRREQKNKEKKTQEVKTERIKVEAVATGRTETLAQPGSTLKATDISSNGFEKLYIYYTSQDAISEILNSLQLVEENTEAKVYLKQVGTLADTSNVIKNQPSYEFKLHALFEKYRGIEAAKGELTGEDIDELLIELVAVSGTIKDPLDKDQYKKLFLSQPYIKEIGVSDDSLTNAIDKLGYRKQKEQQKKEFDTLLHQVEELKGKGKITEALELLSVKSKDIKCKDKTTEFSGLLLPSNEDKIKEQLQNKPDSLDSGYKMGGEELLIPAGAITIIAAPTSHGKTTFLNNLALNVADRYKGKTFHFFSYEEAAESVLISALNTYVGEELTSHNRNRDSIEEFFKYGTTNYIKADKVNLFHAKRQRFFSDLVNTGRLKIHYVDYNSDTLMDAITFLHKHEEVGGILIDYMQLLHKGDRGRNKYGNRQEELKQICLDLKDVAVETGLPIILGAQFNREVTNHLDLQYTNIREAADIEQIANLIIGLWNNDFEPSGEKGELNEIAANNMDTPDTIFAKILKRRGGKRGLTELFSYNGNAGKICNDRAFVGRLKVDDDPFAAPRKK